MLMEVLLVGPVIKSIDDYKKEEAAKKAKAEEEAAKEKKIFVTPAGKHKCVNKGCLKEFDPAENDEGSCSYHPGNPIFHDLKKFWDCCKKETYDWDDFVALPTCKKGKHVPKYV
jgi:hypothetical protein